MEVLQTSNFPWTDCPGCCIYLKLCILLASM